MQMATPTEPNMAEDICKTKTEPSILSHWKQIFQDTIKL